MLQKVSRTSPNARRVIVIGCEDSGSIFEAFDFWAGCGEISAPSLKADVGLWHVSVHPYKTWLRWLEAAGMSVIRKVRGPMIFGGPFSTVIRFSQVV